MNTNLSFQLHTPASRRAFLQGSLAGAAGLLAASPQSSFAAPTTRPAKAKSVIQIWMWGGPSHLDTFDPKPEAGYDYCGPLTQTQATNVSGVRIGQLLPQLAAQADKYSIIRSMTHGVNAHETATYTVQTGHPSGGRIVYPCVGAVVSLLKGYEAGYEGLIPPYIVLTQPLGRFSECGFLGSSHKPFATGGDPGQREFIVEGVHAEGISEARQRARRGLLQNLNSLAKAVPNDPQMVTLKRAEQEAYDLILGEAGKVFDLSEEKDELRDRYGRSTFGQSCLMARRLVEQGVRFVTINYKGWDTHKQHFQTMRRRLPEMDRAVAMLLQDLSDHGLLDSTIVWWSGEFGRTPRVQWEPPWNGGRGHYGRVFSAMVAGGGFRGGCVLGASDSKGSVVEDRPVYPADLIGSMYALLGIAPDAAVRHPQGMTVRLTPGAEDGVETGGLLTEIM